MSMSATPPVGQALRQAREAQGISLDDAAVRLRLMHRQIEAMEADDFPSLGQPVFARGFVRNYARLLGLDPEPLLAGMGGATSEPVVVHREAPLPSRSWLASPWLWLILAVLLLLAVVPVALYWWLNSEEDEDRFAPSAMPTAAPRASARVAPPALPTTPAEPANLVVAPVVAPAVAPQTEVPGVADTAAPAVSTPTANGALQLEFGAESWVEISDATRRMLHRQLNQPGSSIEIRGTPPFDLVIGNAAQVRMTYNGRPIDLTPFIDVTVARFTLEE